MELIYAIGRYLDGQDVVHKSHAIIALSLITLVLNPNVFGICAVVATVLSFSLGIGKFNSAYDGKSYDFEEKSLFGLDFIPDYFAKKNKRLGGIVGMGIRFFIATSPLLYWTWFPIVLSLAGLVYYLGWIIDTDSKGIIIRDKGWCLAEFLTGGLVGKCIYGG